MSTEIASINRETKGIIIIGDIHDMTEDRIGIVSISDNSAILAKLASFIVMRNGSDALLTEAELLEQIEKLSDGCDNGDNMNTSAELIKIRLSDIDQHLSMPDLDMMQPLYFERRITTQDEYPKEHQRRAREHRKTHRQTPSRIQKPHFLITRRC